MKLVVTHRCWIFVEKERDQYDSGANHEHNPKDSEEVEAETEKYDLSLTEPKTRASVIFKICLFTCNG